MEKYFQLSGAYRRLEFQSEAVNQAPGRPMSLETHPGLGWARSCRGPVFFRSALPALLLTLVFWPGLFAHPAEAQRDYIQPIPITSTQLTEAYNRGFHQADAAYTGKLLLVTGRIKSIRPPAQRNYNYQFDKLYSFMTLDAGRGNRPLGVYFWDWEAEKLGRNRPRVNDMVTVMGFCQGVTPHLSIIEACIYPAGCGGPKRNFDGNYYELPPSPVPRR